MFTGLIQACGTVASSSDFVLVVDLPVDAWEGDPIQIGESIAVNGVCVTATNLGSQISFDLSQETMDRTSLGALLPGSRVNLERAMRVGDRLGGHIVQGHVDGMARIVSIDHGADSSTFIFELAGSGEHYLIDKGSITLDGISLTVVRPEGSRFETWIIPHTLEFTNLRSRAVGDVVNVEFDVLAKYVERLLAYRGP
jgi:riboflavin synthase